MPIFVLHCLDRPDSLALRLSLRPAHLAHAQSLGDGLLRAGPLLDGAGQPCGSLIMIEVADQAAADAFAAADPYATGCLFAQVLIHPYRQALPAD
jgi:uncharacterized protein